MNYHNFILLYKRPIDPLGMFGVGFELPNVCSLRKTTKHYFLFRRFGRRPVFLISTLTQFLFMGITSFAWSYETYLLGLSLVTFSAYLNYVTGYVLGMTIQIIFLSSDNIFMNTVLYSNMNDSSSYAFQLLKCWEVSEESKSE